MTTVSIGGCVYRSMVHCVHSTSVAAFAAQCLARDGITLSGIHYQHTSNLPQGRSLWLRARIDARNPLEHYAISVDSDTGFDPVELIHSLVHVNRNVAIGVAPVICNLRTPQLNVFIDGPNGRRPLSPSECGTGHPELWGGGFGLVVFNLRWFREHWSTPHAEPYGDSEDWINQGEDTQMCRSVISRGGTVVPIWVGTTHYDTSGNGVVGARLSYEAGRMVAA